VHSSSSKRIEHFHIAMAPPKIFPDNCSRDVYWVIAHYLGFFDLKRLVQCSKTLNLAIKDEIFWRDYFLHCSGAAPLQRVVRIEQNYKLTRALFRAFYTGGVCIGRLPLKHVVQYSRYFRSSLKYWC
jgi:hypothetical protein